MEHGFSGKVEFSADFRPKPGIKHAVFDFDGTLSLIREGWPDVMLPMFLEMLPSSESSSLEEDRQMLLDDMMELTGKQTIYQMIRLAERIKERGGTPEDPLRYKHEYLDRLNQKIENRHKELNETPSTAENYLLYNSIELLDLLVTHGISIYLASGTDEVFVKKEAAMLGIDHYFNGHIYGAQDDYKSFSKKMIIEKILKDNGICGDELISFGDGYVEIENTKEVGGMAIAVASDEAHNGSGNMDPWKKERLARVGADIFIPDFRDARLLMNIILGKCEIPGRSLIT